MNKVLIKLASLSLLLSFAFTTIGFSSNLNNPTSNNDDKIIVLHVDDPYMYINGVKRIIDPGIGTSPAVFDNRTLLPVRSVVETLGGIVGWVPEDNKANIYYNNKLIEIWIGHKETYINGELNELDVYPRIVNGRTLLPLRFIAESLDCRVLWDDKKNKISIFKNMGIYGKSVAAQYKNSLGGLWLDGTGRLDVPVTDLAKEISIVIPDSTINPFKQYESSTYLQNIHRKTGIKVNLTAYPLVSYNDRVNLMVAANDLPDVLWEVSNFSNMSRFTSYGIFLPYSKYFEHMPNLADIFYTDPDLKRRYSSNSGDMYVLPYINEKMEAPAILVREDIMEEERLKMPDTYEEFYNILKYLKQKYPKLIPFAWHPGVGKSVYAVLADSWNTGFGGAFGNGFYINRDNDRYQFGPIEDGFRQMTEFLARLYKEGLLDPEFAVASQKSWEESIISGKILTSIASTSMIKTMNDIFYNADSKARLAAIIPPSGPNGKRVMLGNQSDMPEYGAVISARVKDPGIVCSFMDWFYSGDGALESSYGILDETYEKNEDGTVSWTVNMKNSGNPGASKNFNIDYGVGKGLKRYQFNDKTMIKSSIPKAYDDRLDYSISLLDEAEVLVNPDPFLEFASEDQYAIRSKEYNISSYVNESLIKFIFGVKPLSGWDKYVDDVKNLGVNDILGIYNEAYNKYKDR